MRRRYSGGVVIREARPDDALQVARVHVRAWQVGYRGLLPAAYLERLRPEDRAARYVFGGGDPAGPATFVVVEDDAIRGFAMIGAARDGTAAGELWALYVDPDAWGRGLGRALVAAARGELVQRRHAQAVVWALEGNERADRFYRADGWSPDGTRRTEMVGGVEASDLRYRRALP